MANKYKKIECIACGSEADVWLSAAEGRNDLYALKIYRSAEGSEACRQEYARATAVTHPHILQPVELTEIDGLPTLVTPYCTGRSAAAAAGYLTESRSWQLLRDIGSALEALHSAGIAHLNVCPTTVLWQTDHFVLSGFDRGHCRATTAPEQTSAEGMAATDIWALGATVFYLYMGCHVWNGLGGATQTADSPLPYLRKSLPTLSTLVTRMLSYRPTDRPTAAEIASMAATEARRADALPPRAERTDDDGTPTTVTTDDFWPEDMVPTAIGH